MIRASLLLGLVLLAAPVSAQDGDDQIRALIADADALGAVSVRRFDEALAKCVAADRLSESSMDLRLRATVRAKLALALYNVSRPAESVEAGRQAAEIARRAGALDVATNALRAAGGSLLTLARFAEAESALTEAADIAASLGMADELARALSNLNVNAKYQGRLGDAIAYGRRAVAVLERALAEGQPVSDVVQFTAPFNLGKALADSGDYTDSRVHLERSFIVAERTQNIGGQMHVLFDTGEWYEAQGDLNRAERYYRRSIEFNRIHPSAEGEGKGYRGLGRVLLATGRGAAAVAALSEALRLFEAGNVLFAVPPTLVELARARAQAGDRLGAERDLERAIVRSDQQRHQIGAVIARLERGRQRARDGRFVDALADFDHAVSRALGNRLMPLVPAGLVGLATVAEGQGHHEEALLAYEQAATSLERIRGRIVDLELRANFAAATREIFAGMIRVLMRLNAAHPGRGYDARAFAALERERSQALDLSVIQARSTAARGPSSSAEVRIAHIQNALFSPDLSDTNRQSLLRALDDAERDLTLGQRALPVAGHSGSAPSRQAITLASLQSALTGDDTVIEYAGDAAFVVTRDAMRIVRLNLPTDLEARIDFFGRALASNASDASRAAGRALAAVLVDPLLPSMTAKARLLIVASGAIARLPFAALPMPDGQGRVVPLLARHEVAYLPSLTIFEARRSHPSPALARRVLVVADAASANARARSFQPLPASRSEARFIAGVLPDARVLIAGAATEIAVKQAADHGYPVLHLATHALLDADLPERSAILLGAEGGEDGLLQSREIYQMRLRGSLVVLTGCRTADGHTAGADGLRSLSRAFLQAGGRTVVGSLWDLPDRSASHIMRTFYSKLNQSGDAGSALREAQLALGGADAYAHSRTWAAMVLLGDPSTMLAARAQGVVAWLPAIVVMLLVGVVAVSKR